MKQTYTKTFAMSFLAVFLMLFFAGTVLAAAFQLSGRVTDQSGSPIAGVTVAVIDPATSTTLASATTDATGNYALSIDAGTYDIKVTPAVGSGYAESVSPGQVISGDTVVDFALVPAGSITLTGKVLDPYGVGIPNQNISLLPAGGGTNVQQSTDISGTYTFLVTAGNYTLQIATSNNPVSINAPQYYGLFNASTIALTQSTVMDIALPSKKVVVHVQDPAGTSIAGVRFRTNMPINYGYDFGAFTARGYGDYRSPSAATDTSGNATLWLFTTQSNHNYTISAFPPTGSPFADFNISNVSVTGDKSINIILQFVHAPPYTTLNFDRPPTPAGTYDGDVTVALTATATSGYTVDSTYYQLDGGSTMRYTTPFSITGDGVHTISYRSIDNIGVFEITKTVSIQIDSLKITTPLLPAATINTPYAQTLNATGGTSPYTWAVVSGTLPPGLALDTGSGQLTGTPTVIGDYAFTVEVTDSIGTAMRKLFSLTVQVPPLVIVTNSPLPDGTIGQPYSTTLTAVGGTEPYTWSIASGALPPGLAIDSVTGLISGTPTTAGTFGFTVQVTDSSAQVTTKQFALAPPPSSGTAGSTYTQPVSVVDTPPNSSTPPTCSNYAVVGGALPGGLILDPTTGIISGTPTDGGTYTVTVQCVVSSGQTATKDFTITINNPLPTLTAVLPDTVIAGTSSFSLTLNGTNFVESSSVLWNGTARPTVYVSDIQLVAQILATDIPSPGVGSVSVSNPNPVGGVSNALNVTIQPPNSPPVAAADAFQISEDTISILNVLQNDTDPDNDVLTISGMTAPGHGTVSINIDRTLTYTPALNYFGPDAFSYTIDDGHGHSATAQVSIQIDPINDPPVAVADSAETNEDTSVIITVLSNDTDVEADVLAVSAVIQPAHGSAGILPDGTVIYTPTLNYNGSDVFTYTVDDGNGGTDTAGVTLTIIPINDAPVIDAAAAAVTVDEGQSATNNGTMADVDGDVLLLSATVGTVVDNGDGTWTWVYDTTDGPAESQTVTISADDGFSGLAEVQFALTVNNVAPTVNAGIDQIVNRNDPLTVSGHWFDPGGMFDGPFQWSWDVDSDGVSDASGSAAYGQGVTQTTQFALEGFYTLTFDVADKDGGSGSDSLLVEVQNQSPVCSLAEPSVSKLWPVNHKFVPIDIQGITDAEGDNLTVTVDSIFQDEPVNAVGNGDGNTSPDGRGIGNGRAEIRAERDGDGNGRVYFIRFTAVDGHGGSCSGEVQVGVPHNKKDTPVSDGPLYDSTGTIP